MAGSVHTAAKRVMCGITNLIMTNDNIGLYVIRKYIFDFIKRHGYRLKGVMLDLGCGTKPYREYLLSLGNIEKYVGLDLETSNHYDVSVADIHWNGKQIPLANCSIDSIITTEVLEHCPNPEAVIKEMHRILKPGGVVLLTVPFLWPIHDSPNDEFRYTNYSLKRFFDSAGFKYVNLYALSGWHGSLALLLGLWVDSAPMKKYKRILLQPFCRIIANLLLRRDKTNEIGNNSMMVGIGGLIEK